MSSDPAPFVPPERYPSPPKNMWYEVPKEPPTHLKEKPKPVFPWETHQPRPTRVFAHQEEWESSATEQASASPEQAAAHRTWPDSGPAPATGDLSTAQQPPQTPPSGPTSRSALSATAPTDIWSSFPRTNAWDNVPEINRYVDKVQKHSRTQSRNLALAAAAAAAAGAKGGGAEGDEEEQEGGGGRRGSRVTDFPSEDDRPSLPVTPAPRRRPRRWGGGAGGGLGGMGGGDDEEERLPGADGVPAQSDWVCVHGIWWGPADCLCDLANVLRGHKDPVAQLQKLAREQSELLLQRLGGGSEGGDGEGGLLGGVLSPQAREIPSRPLPFGSEDARSPTYVAPAPPVPLVSPTPVKPHTGASPVNRILAAAPEFTSPSPPPPPAADVQSSANAIPIPSYQGPGLAFEKGEDVPAYETPALPTEEEQDVLLT